MKKIAILLALSLAMLLSLGSTAQNTPTPKVEKKVIVTIIDENGNVTTQEFKGTIDKPVVLDDQLTDEARKALEEARIYFNESSDSAQAPTGDGRITFRFNETGGDGEAQIFEWDGENAAREGIQRAKEALENLRDKLPNLDIDVEIPNFDENWKDFRFEIPKIDVRIDSSRREMILKECRPPQGNGGPNKAVLGVALDFQATEENGNRTTAITISEVFAGSGAQAAGLQAGDQITGVDGKNVVDVPAIHAALKDKKPGDVVAVAYLRNGAAASVNVTLKENQSAPQHFFIEKERPYGPYIRGSVRQTIIPEDACKKIEELSGQPFMGVFLTTYSETPLQVSEVIPNTGAAEAGFAEGDIIKTFDGKPVKSYEELLAAIAKHKPGDRVQVGFLRNGKDDRKALTLKSQADRNPEKIARLREICDQAAKAPLAPETPDAQPRLNEAPQATGAENVLVYPNPNRGLFTLSFSGPVAPVLITVNDTQGQTVWRKEVRDFNGSYSEDIDLSNNAKGIYFVNVNINGKTQTQKVIVN